MIKKINGKFVVMDSEGKETLGVHLSKDKAEQQLKAIEANKKPKNVARRVLKGE